MKSKIINKSSVLICVLLLCIFENFIASLYPLFKYYDEILTALSIPLIIIKFAKGTKHLKKTFESKLCFWLMGFLIFGTISFFTNSTQPIVAFWGDLFLNLKFYLALYIGFTLYSYRLNINLIIGFIKFVTVILFVLLIINFLYPIFPSQEIRFGIRIPRLFFTHSGYVASAGTLLLTMTYRYYMYAKRPMLYIAFQSFIIFSSLSYKAMAIVIVSLLIFIVVVVGNQKLGFRHYIIAAAGIVLIAWEQIRLYYGRNILTNARGALTITGLRIANDNFPLGSGFGTFGSYMSKVYYSNVYLQYGISNIWGLSENSQSFSFISDTFWPMIIGQNGWLGAICFTMTIILIFKQINKMKVYDKYRYMSCICSLAYLAIESTSSAAFVSPQAVPFGSWIGLMLHDYKSDFRIIR